MGRAVVIKMVYGNPKVPKYKQIIEMECPNCKKHAKFFYWPPNRTWTCGNCQYHIPDAVMMKKQHAKNPKKPKGEHLSDRLEPLVKKFAQQWMSGDKTGAKRTRLLIEEIAGKYAMPYRFTSRELNCPHILAEEISCSAQVRDKQGMKKVKPWAVCRAEMKGISCKPRSNPKPQSLQTVVNNLDPFEEHQYKHLTGKSGLKPEEALHIIVNSVEGDTSQLSDGLAAYARAKGWFKGFEAEYNPPRKKKAASPMHVMGNCQHEVFKMAYGDNNDLPCQILHFRLGYIQKDQIEPYVDIIGKYRDFDPVKVKKAMAEVADIVEYYDIGRAYSPVMFIHFVNWKDKDVNYARIKKAFVEGANASEFDLQHGDIIRAWWD